MFMIALLRLTSKSHIRESWLSATHCDQALHAVDRLERLKFDVLPPLLIILDPFPRGGVEGIVLTLGKVGGRGEEHLLPPARRMHCQKV